MTAFLVVAHGSRLESSVKEVETLTRNVGERLGTTFDAVDFAFLQWAEPSIPAKVEELVTRGVTEILLVPYLLSMGTHVAQDIPAAVTELEVAHPGLRIRVTRHIGAAPGMVDLLCSHARSEPAA